MIDRAVITTGGLGSRMRDMTLIVPKALLPLIRRDEKPALIPIIDLIIARLRGVGVSKFLIVIGRNGKPLIDYLMDKVFSGSLNGIQISFTFQESPRGFGDAVLKAEDFVNSNPFFVHADDGLLTMGYAEGVKVFNELRPDALLFLREVSNPSRYGVAIIKDEKLINGFRLVKVLDVEEKPPRPRSNIAILATYIFSKKIIDALKTINITEGELELTYGIKRIIEMGGEIYGLVLSQDTWLSVGDPENYIKTINKTYNLDIER
ncbi:MAG: nucleotidyltransferase family protein [Vulcanisaeta sp. AZ3]|jgi:dTDP-glucose pyrophosphorylase